MQYICFVNGSKIVPGKGEEGVVMAAVETDSELFRGLGGLQEVMMSHNDGMDSLPAGFRGIARTENCSAAAFENNEKRLYGVMFHPEVKETLNGTAIFNNFLYGICKATGDYSLSDYLERQIDDIRKKVGSKKILLALSGGIDSSVCAALLSEAVGSQLVCIFINHGFMRKNEPEEVKAAFSGKNLNFIYVDARKRFLDRLSGVTNPEEKRKIIGDEFIRAFEDEAKKCGNPEFLAQGTIYPDIIESGLDGGALVKSHHNVGGLPDTMNFEGIIEPLSGLFKNEVRKLGLLLNLPKNILTRQPFPGPGIAVRVLGELTEEKLDILREADYIVREEISNSDIDADQFFAVLTNIQSVGVTRDAARTYEYTVAVRAVKTSDFMTCEVSQIPYPLLLKISSRITKEVMGVNRVVYDITGKPPATIEWE
jgi:GMP synthase (glutamine-hydrolysing)